MNKDVFEGKWKQMRGQIKLSWGKLTDDDLDRVQGDMDILIGKIQEQYGTSREAIERRLDTMSAELTHSKQ